jgi:DNA-binding transcriptional regulator YhcF (GntR family)
MRTAPTGKPAYQHVADDLRQQISDGRLPVGSQLPTVARLMETYGVSNTVIKSALSQLKAENVVIGQQGKGVYVRQLFRVFLSTPMAALAEDYETDRAAARKLFDQLSELTPPVYWAGERIDSADQFEASDIAAEKNFAALTAANAYVYLQLRDLTHSTSALVELGVALASRKPITVFAPTEDCLPYALRHFEAVAERVGFGRFRFYSTPDVEEAIRLLTLHGPELIGLGQHGNGAVS